VPKDHCIFEIKTSNAGEKERERGGSLRFRFSDVSSYLT
jgi:hypothetical protein